VGAVIVRALQVYVLSRLKDRMGAVGASACTELLGAWVATLLGFVFYGGDALATTMTFFDAVFIFPAYFLTRSFDGREPNSPFVAGAILASTFGIFLSASPFWVPLATVVSLAALAAAAFLALGREASKKVSAALLAFALVGVPLALSTNAMAFSYNLRNDFYPLYPDSLSSSQWIQTISSAACMQGNVAGAGTVQNGVWGPQRLRVLSTCVTVSGVIKGLTPTSGPANDNDFGIDIKPDSQFTPLLSICNLVIEGGLLHLEVVPSQQPSLANTLASLRPGDKITVTGSLVLDTDHGYGAEIHPVWAILSQPAQ
jgi:hypothetical protein